jgi:hypothetical protein
MFSAAVAFAAFFAFGYCIADIVISWRSERRINKLIKDFEVTHKKNWPN